IVLGNAKAFGANVWSGAVNILSSFIHNEPTSYAVIAEAGLSKGLLEAVTCKEITVPEEDKKDTTNNARTEGEAGPSAVIEEAGEDEGDASDHYSALPSTGNKIDGKDEVRLIRRHDRPLAEGIL